MCKCVINDDTYALVNLYAPNVNAPNYFLDLFKQIVEMNCDYHILGGNFNLVFDVDMDRNWGGGG